MAVQRVAIVGAGKGGKALIQVLNENENITIAGVCDVDPIAPGLVEAKRLGLNTFNDYKTMLARCRRLDVIINVTKDPKVGDELACAKRAQTELIHGRTAMLVWELTMAQRQLMNDAEQRLSELKDLYELGLKLSSSGDLREVYTTIIDYATMLTQTPAASIAVMDEKTGEMTLGAAKGFSQEFYKLTRWKLRKGGLTSQILNQDSPTIILDIDRLAGRINPVLALEGVRSLIASPLTVRGKIVGILYVDDFVRRDFGTKDISVLSLLSGYAALAIERMKLLDDTKKMAITDGLTGLSNQQEFLNRLEEEVSRSQRYDRPLSIIELDIDFFKLYNDRHGHVAGNELLRVLADTVSRQSRVTDVCARIGGEEFAVLMPETEFEEAIELAERLRVVVEKLPVGGEHGLVCGITVSMGVASFPAHGRSAVDLYRSADQALYTAKEAGRNCVIGFPQLGRQPTAR